MRAIPVSDTGLKCSACRGLIRAGQPMLVEPWPNRGGFSYQHETCPEPSRSADPSKRVIQGSR